MYMVLKKVCDGEGCVDERVTERMRITHSVQLDADKVIHINPTFPQNGLQAFLTHLFIFTQNTMESIVMV